MSRTDGGGGEGSGLPTVTVVMPVHNGRPFLEEQVATILGQEGVSVQLVAADDGSTDGSADLLEQIASGEPRMRVIRNAGNVGLMRTLSLLLREVRGGYFALADQDDIWDRTKLAMSVAALRDRGAALVYSDVRLVDEAGEVRLERYLPSRGLTPVEGRDPVPFLFRNPAIGHTMVGRAEVAQTVGEIDPTLLAHEVWIIARACRIGQVVFLDRVLGSYRQHGGNVVGARPSVIGRLWRLFGPEGRIVRRQVTRARAFRALARDWPDLRPVDALQRAEGVRRLLGWPRFAGFVWSRGRVLGLSAVMAEVVFFLLPVGRA